MRVTNVNNLKVYSLSNPENLAIPDWAARVHKRKLKKDPEWAHRIELIQDYGFPEACSKIKATRDGEYVIATGVYKPRFKVYNLDQKSLKFERHTDAETVQFQILSDDWSKIVLLQNDRTIEFHAKYGLHHSIRVPQFGRDMVYDEATCDLLVAGAGSEIWKVNLETGSFLKSYSTDSSSINSLRINAQLGLLSSGGSNCVSDFFHPDMEKKVASLDVGKDLKNSCDESLLEEPEITYVQYCQDNLSIMYGTSTGHILIYDIRSSKPVTIQEHKYGLPINFIQNHSKNVIFSSDKKVVRIWDKNTGEILTAVEPEHDINDVCIFGNSGLFSCATESTSIESFYIPSIGHAPKWYSYIENVTEEMEETNIGNTYDDYKFVTKEELTRLSMDHLIGTSQLVPYIHGFFIDLKLYMKAKAIASPFAYEEYKKRIIREKLEKRAASRIIPQGNLPKINRNFAERILSKSSNSKKDDSSFPSQPKSENLLEDDRFKDMFEDQDFEIDETAEEWKIHHPSESTQKV